MHTFDSSNSPYVACSLATATNWEFIWDFNVGRTAMICCSNICSIIRFTNSHKLNIKDGKTNLFIFCHHMGPQNIKTQSSYPIQFLSQLSHPATMRKTMVCLQQKIEAATIVLGGKWMKRRSEFCKKVYWMFAEESLFRSQCIPNATIGIDVLHYKN